MKTLEEILQHFHTYGEDEKEANRELLTMVKSGTVSEDLYLEFLSVTQGDVIDLLTDTLADD